MESTKQYVSWRRVSTKKQGRSGLGLEAQKDIIEHFTKDGEVINDFCETYTGKDLSGCTELRKAIALCKETGATLVIAKTDRFRNVIEALQIVEELPNQIMFCDLPSSDKFTLTIFFALAEREALMVSIRTKAALKAKKAREDNAVDNYGKNTGAKREETIKKAREAAAKTKRLAAKNNSCNKLFWGYYNQYKENHSLESKQDFVQFADFLNEMGLTTPTGLPFSSLRAISMRNKCKNIYLYNN